ncbi:MAG: glycosyltransferase family 87 protein [Planctomycetota bacterium]
MFDTRRRKVIFIVLFLLVFSTAAFMYGKKCFKKPGFSNIYEESNGKICNDFCVFYTASKNIFSNQNIYTETMTVTGRQYIYPPIFALICAPFAALGVQAALLIWYIGSMTALLVSAYLSTLIVLGEKPDFRKAFFIGAAAVVLTGRAFDSDFQNGQINTLILLLVVVALYCVIRNLDTPAGLIMALAVCIKMTPVIFLPYFLYKRMWKTSLWFVIGLIIFLVIIPSVLLGLSRNFSLLGEFSNKMISPFISIEEPPELYEEAGQSLRAATFRFLTKTDAASRAIDEVYVNVADLSRSTAWIIYIVAAFAILSFTLFSLRCDGQDRTNYRLSLEFTAVILLMLLLSPVSRKAHHVVLLLPYAAIAAYTLRKKVSIRVEKESKTPYCLAVTAIIFMFLTHILTGREIVGRELCIYFLSVSCFFWGTLFLWLSVVLILLSEVKIPNIKGKK